MVRRHRQRLGLSQTELGARVGRTKQWVSEVERDHVNLSYEMTRALAAVFGETPDGLFLSSESKEDGPPQAVAS